MDSKKKLILGMILVLLVITITGTFAYLEWVKKVGRMVLTIGDISTTEVRISPYLISGSFSPRVTYEGEQYMEVRITNNENKSNKIAVYYEVKNIDSNLRNKYMKYTITKSESLNGTYMEYAEGDFSSVSSGDKLEILNESVPTGVNYYYKVYLWIDGSTGSGATYYTFERGTSVYTNRPTNWSGYVGLAYPSDYLYTFAKKVDDECSFVGRGCTGSDSSWMYVMYNSKYHWFISSSTDLYSNFYMYNGTISLTFVFASAPISPTVYLKPEVELTGEGTSGNPYVIK